MNRSSAMFLGLSLLAAGCKDKRECPDREGDDCEETERYTCECDECGTTWCCELDPDLNRVAWFESAEDCDCIDEDGEVHYDDTAWPECVIEY